MVNLLLMVDKKKSIHPIGYILLIGKAHTSIIFLQTFLKSCVYYLTNNFLTTTLNTLGRRAFE